MSTITTDVIRTDDTLYVSNNAKLGSGSTGYILVDDGTTVVPKPTFTDNYVLCIDTASSDNLNYKPLLQSVSYITVPLMGSINLMNNGATYYANYNAFTATFGSTTVDYYSIPYASNVKAIELIVTDTGSTFSWPTFNSAAQYFAVTIGYESSGVFTPFGPSSPHFTISQAIAPLAGVTNFSRSGQYGIVRFTPSSNNWTWNVTPGMHIGLRLVANFSFTSRRLNTLIYLEGLDIF